MGNDRRDNSVASVREPFQHSDYEVLLIWDEFIGGALIRGNGNGSGGWKKHGAAERASNQRASFKPTPVEGLSAISWRSFGSPNAVPVKYSVRLIA